ncbi:putative calcineurin-like phosphoesterase [Hypoxylon sp. NC1633]|nr:putative calcineurin-like phosphoesterase [Hypoxylon sp. NC1633]
MAAFLRSLLGSLLPLEKPRVQIISDLHLEIGQQYTSYTVPVNAPFLVLGGDIGRLIDYRNYRTFLQTQVSQFTKVFLVLGNHEFYGLTYEDGLEQARRLADEPSLADKLVLLHKTRWDDPDSSLTVLGCTLWSNIPDQARSIIETTVNDFKHIRFWSAEKHNQAHADEITWLREEVARIASQEGKPPRRLLIATHHAPCVKGTSSPEHANNPWAPAFSTDLLSHGGWDCVKTWAFGHTHYSTRLTRHGVKLVANQRGYVFPGQTTQIDQFKKKGGKARYDFDAAVVFAI